MTVGAGSLRSGWSPAEGKAEAEAGAELGPGRERWRGWSWIGR